MAEHGEAEHSLLEKITEKISGHSPSSSDSDDDKSSSFDLLKSKVSRLFGRETPVHKVFGGGKSADILLWRDKKLSACVLGGATAIWVLFELVEYHLVTLVCHTSIASLAILFVWSNVSTFLHKPPPKVPDLRISEKCAIEVPSTLRFEINRGIAALSEIASGKDLKKFLVVMAGLWIFSIVGSCCNFVTLLYINVILLFTVPLLYEKYEDQVDSFVEKSTIEIKKYYAVFKHKVLHKIPRGPMNKDRKKD